MISKTQCTYLHQFLWQQLLQHGFVVILLDKAYKCNTESSFAGLPMLSWSPSDEYNGNCRFVNLRSKFENLYLNTQQQAFVASKMYFHILLRDKAISQNLTYKRHEELTFRCCRWFRVTNLMKANFSLIYSKNLKLRKLGVNRKHLWILMYCFSWYFSMWLRDFGWKTNSNPVRAKHRHFRPSPDRWQSVN